MSNVVNFADAVRNFTGKMYDALLSGANSFTASSLAPSNGRLSGNLALQVAVGDGDFVDIDLNAADTAGNNTLADLIAQLNDQLDAAGVTATNNGGRLTFSANSGQVLKLKFQGNQEGMLDLGFASTLSNALYRFDTIQEFVTELAAVTGVGLGDIGLDYDPGTKSFAFNLEFDRAFQRELHLHFLEELATPVGTLSLAGGAHAHIDASVALDIRVGFDLSPVGEGFALQPTTSLDSLTNGAFPTAGSGKNDFKITSANGSSIEISLFGAATIQDVIDRVNASGHVTLAIDPSNPARLLLTDNNSPVGTGVLKVERLNNSSAGTALGILGTDHDSDGDVEGVPLHGDSLLKKAFIEEGGSISASAAFHAHDLGLRAALSLLELGLEGEIDFSISAAAQLKDPGDVASDGKITVGEFAQSATGALDGLTLTADGDISATVLLDGLEDFGISLGTAPTLAIDFSASGTSIDIDPQFSGFDSLASFGDFSTDDVFGLVTRALAFIQSSDMKLFNERLPLINKSINDLLNFAQPLQDALNGVDAELADARAWLLGKLGTIKQAIASPDLLDHLSEEQILELVDGLDVFDQAVLAVPEGVDGAGDWGKGKLIAAMGVLREAIGKLPEVSDSNYEAKLNELRNAFTDVSSLLPAVQKLADFMFRALGLDLPDLSAGGAIDAIRTQLVSLITDLEGDSVPTEVLENLVAARDKLQDAVEKQGLMQLMTAFDRLRQGVADVSAYYDGLGDPTNQLAQDTRALFNQLVAKFAERVGFSYADDKLELRLGFDYAPAPFTVPLDFQLDGGAIPVNLETSGALTFEVGAGLQFDFGIDLSDTVPEPYLLPSSLLRASVRVDASDEIDATLSLGGIKAVEIVDGTFTLSASGNPQQPAQLVIGFKGTDPIQLSDLTDINTYDLSATTGELAVSLPFKVLGNTATLDVSLADLKDLGSFAFDPTDLDALRDLLDFGELSLLDFFRNIPEFLDLLSDTLQSDILAQLPLIGDSFVSGGEYLGQFNEKFVNPIVSKIEDLIDGANDSKEVVETALKKIIFDTLGQGLDDIDVITGPGMDILWLADGSAKVTSFEEVDVQVNVADGETLLSDPNAEVIVNLRLKALDTLEANFDLGLDGFGLVGVAASGGVEVGVDFDIQVGFGINKSDGFFLNLPATGPEIAFGITAGFSDDTQVKANLFFLDIALQDNGSSLGGGFDIDLTNPANNRVPLNQIGSIFDGLAFDLEVATVLDVTIVASINSDPDFPSIAADLDVLWDFKLNDPTGGAAPSVDLSDITLDLGKFVSKQLVPLIEGLQEFTTAIQPLIDVLNTEIPVISQLSQLVGQGPFTFLDGIALFGEGGESVAEFVRILGAATEFIGNLGTLDGSLQINLGDFDFAGQDLRTGSKPTLPDLKSLDELNDLSESLTQGGLDPGSTSTFTAGADTSNGIGIKFPLLQDPASILHLLFGGDVDLVVWDVPPLAASFEFSQIFGPIVPPFPIFAKLGGGFGVFADFYLGLDTRGLRTGNFLNGFFFGDNPQGLDGDAPELGLDLSFTAGAELNIGGIVVAGVEGGITAGIRADWNDPDGNGKIYLDELLENLTRGIECVFDLSGELSAFLRAYLKVEIDLGLFNITLIDTSFTLFKATLFSFTVSCPPLPPPEPARMDESTLLLNIGPDAGKRRAGDTDGDEIIKVIGEQDVRDSSGNLIKTEDLNGDGQITEEEVIGDIDGNGTIDAGVVAVVGFGQTRLFGRSSDATLAKSFFKSTTLVTGISGDGRDGDDEILLEAVKVSATLKGGAGDDVITGSSAGDELYGDDGNDSIAANGGNDTVHGGEGDDELFGNAGADTIAGDGGNDTIYGGSNDGIDEGDLGDSLTGDAGDDRIYGHAGNDWADGGSGADFLGGAAGNDTLLGGADNDTILGEEGNDSLSGNGGDDQIKGGVGHDALFGDAGDDWMEGGEGNDTMSGGDGADKMIGGGSDSGAGADGNDVMDGGKGNDRMAGGNAAFGSVTLFSGTGDDTIVGGEGADEIYGQGGADIIYGDKVSFSGAGATQFDSAGAGDGTGGNDTIQGNDGADIIVAGDGADRASGGDDDAVDLILGDNGSITLVGSVVTDVLSSGFAFGGNDTLRGGAGDDIVIGGFGDDDILGSEGHDILLGDHGRVERNDNNSLKKISAIGTDQGGSDTIQGYDGDDTIFGGIDDDTITGNSGADILLGDNGEANYSAGLLVTILSTAVTHFGDDLITGAAGADTIIGGSGRDDLAGAGQDDILLGDNGKVTRDASFVTRIETTDPTHGDADTILGANGDDSAFGGAGDDSVVGGDGRDLLGGDHGFIDLVGGVPTLIESTDPNDGGEDSIWGGLGDDLLVGGSGGSDSVGSGGDSLLGEEGADIMIGDNARITRHASDAVLEIRTIFPDKGGDDSMFGGAAGDTMLGGYGSDSMEGGDGADVMLGDNGLLDYEVNGEPAPLQHITTTDPNDGHSDIMAGQDGNDTMMGGTDDEDMTGGAGRDLMFGDHGEVFPPQPANNNFFSIDTAATDGGGSDTIHGNADDDTIIGGQQGDSLFGDSHDDDMIGGHNNPNDAFGGRSDGDDTMDGGAGDDMMAGDNAQVIRQVAPNYTSPLVRTLTEGAIYGTDAEANIDAAHRRNPTGAVGRDVTLLDHADDTPAGRYGDDLMAGNADDDTMFGQLGNDLMRGDGFIDEPAGTALKSTDNSTDGDDYMEGNGGEDTMYGDLGQDDMIGGNSNLFGLATPASRPDGDDTMFGGDGTDTVRNTLGDTSANGHARDADVMQGDNANIFRLVNGAATAFLAFNYDNYGSLKLVPRATVLLDYDPTDPNDTPIGGNDLMHGEAGDDSMHGMSGHDVLYGEGQDDDVIGGTGNDWISGGTGLDGVLGDDGRIATSRNGTVEPLSGVTTATTQADIATPGKIQQAKIHVTGTLKKAVNLTPFSADPSWAGTADEVLDGPPQFDDVIYGGWGDDSLHGGSGDDAISGAEALPIAAAYDPATDSVILSGYDLPVNPGNLLAFNPEDPDGWHFDPTRRAGEFALYDEYNPLTRITLEDGGATFQFLLNFDPSEGPVDPGSTSTPKKTTDGDDRVFGDLGNDWLVGGTGRDNLYGGWGNDLMNADDDHATNGGLNNQPDTDGSFEDRAYGGAGRDVLIGNTGGDRLIDWVGEFNSYLVPFAPFGMATVSRTLQPQLHQFLYDLSAADGADPTRAGDTGADASRNGEPEGELGLVIQKDQAWRQQTGAPADPQAGNIPGGKRDVLRSANFNGNQAEGFVPESGSWSITGGRYRVEPLASTGTTDAISLFYVDSFTPTYFEVIATINAEKPIAGFKANAYVIFDYQSPTEFKFAGLNVSNNKIEIGHRVSWGWSVDATTNFKLNHGKDYNLFLAINGNAVQLLIDNKPVLSHAFSPRLDSDGFPHTISEGMVGIGGNNAKALIDNVAVQRVFEATERGFDFETGPHQLLDTPLSGTWTAGGGRYVGTAGASPAVNLFDLRVGASSSLELESTFRLGSSSAEGGLVFDHYSATDFKFVTISAATREVVLGHRTAAGWKVDARFAIPGFNVNNEYTLGVRLVGTTVNVTLNGRSAMSYAYNALVTDGGFGLFSRSGAASFDSVILRSDDPLFEDDGLFA